MPSIIPGYEYDVFISYRQKDNKGEKWVTEFVYSLRGQNSKQLRKMKLVCHQIRDHYHEKIYDFMRWVSLRIPFKFGVAKLNWKKIVLGEIFGGL